MITGKNTSSHNKIAYRRSLTAFLFLLIAGIAVFFYCLQNRTKKNISKPQGISSKYNLPKTGSEIKLEKLIIPAKAEDEKSQTINTTVFPAKSKPVEEIKPTANYTVSIPPGKNYSVTYVDKAKPMIPEAKEKVTNTSKIKSLAEPVHFLFSGSVIKNSTGEPLSGVNVIVEGTSKGTITDLNGDYSISIDSSVKSLTFSYWGFERKTMDISHPEPVVKLTEKIKKLNDTTVTASNNKNTADLSNMKKTIEVSDSDLGFQLYKAIQTAQNGDTAKALADLFDITKTNRKYIDAWNEIVKLSLKMRDKKTALQGLKKISGIVTVEKLKNNINYIMKLTETDNYEQALSELTKLKFERQY
jgi:hypothetical protein